jgi:hypothetical protein
MEFYQECIRTPKERKTFADIVANHALVFHELTLAERKKASRGMMDAWVKMMRLTDEWIKMLCNDSSSEFGKVVDDLVNSYSEALRDYVLDKAYGPEWKKKISHIIHLESLFFNEIGCGECLDQWVAYTDAIVTMVDSINDEMFFGYSAAAIRAGKVLGACLDRVRKRVSGNKRSRIDESDRAARQTEPPQ